MTLGTFYRTHLPSQKDERTKEELQWLLEEYCHIEKGNLFLYEEKEIEEQEVEVLWEKLKNIPLQYLIHYQEFLGYRFYVDSRVLIPRNETEELVVRAKEDILKKKAGSVLEIGVGSGAVLFSLILLLQKEKYNIVAEGVEISEDALDVAKKNQENFHLDCVLYLSDVYEKIPHKKYDYILSNPPYIAEKEKVQKRVLENEPHLALFAKQNGMEVYQKILRDLEKHLNPSGTILMEMDPSRREDIEKLAKTYLKNYEIRFYKDLSQSERFCQIQLKEKEM